MIYRQRLLDVCVDKKSVNNYLILLARFFTAPSSVFASNENFLDFFKGVYLTSNYGNSNYGTSNYGGTLNYNNNGNYHNNDHNNYYNTYAHPFSDF